MDTVAENETLLSKMKNKSSFVDDANRNTGAETGASLMSLQMSHDAPVMESLQIVQAEKERDMHKWNSEKLVLEAKMNELNQSLKQKDEESTRREFRMRKKHKEEIDQVEEGYNDQFDEMQGELNRTKTANTYLENNQHQLKLEQEKTNRLLSSSIYHLGLVQV